MDSVPKSIKLKRTKRSKLTKSPELSSEDLKSSLVVHSCNYVKRTPVKNKRKSISKLLKKDQILNVSK